MSHDVLSGALGEGDVGAFVRRSDSRTARALPLALRLPNPPPLLVGRGPMVASVASWLARSPLLVLTGAAGVGKTALALHVLHDMREQGALPPGPTVFVQVGALPPGTLLLQLRKILALGDVPSPDWSLLSASPPEALAALIDLADQGGWSFLLDDVDGMDAAEYVDLMDGIGRYARRSRWLWTARSVDVPSGLHVPRTVVEPLAVEALAVLATALAPNLPTAQVQSLAERADGSARRLTSLLQEAPPATDADLDATRSLLRLLQRPVSARTLAALSLPETHAALQLLQDRGEVLRVPSGFLLRRRPEETDGTVPAPANDVVRALATTLGGMDEEDALLESVRLWLTLEPDRAQALLDTHAYMLCERGFAADLWLLLDQAGDIVRTRPGMRDWKAWCAFEWGDARAQDDAVPPAPDSCLRAHLRARLHLREGRLVEAMEAAETAVELATCAVDRNFARVRGARAAFSLGRTDATLALCDACEEPTGAAAVEVALLRAECAALHKPSEDAAARAEALIAMAEDLPPALRLRAYLGAARVHLMRQRLRDAERVMEAILRVRAERAADAVSGRTAVEIAAAVAAQRGRFQWVRELADRLQRAHQPAPVRLLFTRAYVTTAEEWQGTPECFRVHVASLNADCDADGGSMAWDVRSYGDVLATRIAMREARSFETLGPAQPPEVVSTMLATNRDCVRAFHAARWGQRPALPRPAAGGMVEHQLLLGLAHASYALASGEDEDATALLSSLVHRADESGHALHLVDGLRLQLLSVCHRGAWLELERLVVRAKELADAMAAPRLQEEVAFFAACHTGRMPDPEVLEGWAAASDAIPTRTRWARWWLGGEGPLDPLEQRVWQRCVAAHGWQRALRLGSGDAASTQSAGSPSMGQAAAPWEAGLGIDLERSVVWSSDGVVTDLARHEVLLRILTALFEAGGAASKEELVCKVWGVRDYHPLRHDNRLRVAVRKLRARLGEPAAGRLETLADGYALTGVWRKMGGA